VRAALGKPYLFGGEIDKLGFSHSQAVKEKRVLVVGNFQMQDSLSQRRALRNGEIVRRRESVSEAERGAGCTISAAHDM